MRLLGVRSLRLFGVVLALTLSTEVGAQLCPDVPDNAFAFINSTQRPCPANPGVWWADAQVVFDCRFFADADKQIDCGGDPATCVNLCRTGANVWNTDLPSRFTFIEATDPVTFCDTDDGRVSVGGTTTLCDGSAYGSRVLAVTLSIFFSGGAQTGRLIDANITVNQAFNGFFSQPSFQATVTHELGHVLGLTHPDECGNDVNVLMRSASLFGPSSPCFVLEPTTADINGAARIYPVLNATPTPVATPGMCGDADLNGSLTVSDGVHVLRAAAGLSSNCPPGRCDVDGNGTITITDGVNVLRGAAQLPFTANCP
jgi:hypothetical protein